MINTNLIIGRLGSGKTTCIKHLLAQKPEDEYWGIIVNEFGQIGIDAALIESPEKNNNLNITEITGGCICCAAKTQLRVTLTNLIRQHKPDRILIEATGLGHPAGIIDLLRDEYLRLVINLSSIITVIDLSLFTEAYDSKNLKSPLTTESFTHQTQLADVIVLNKVDLAPESNIINAKDYLSSFYPLKQKIILATQAQLDTKHLSLDSAISSKSVASTIEENHNTSHHNQFMHHNTSIDAFSSESDEHMSCGFIFPAEIVFIRSHLEKLLEKSIKNTTNEIIRLKAVFNCGRLWKAFNAVSSAITTDDSYYRRDSRIEIITTNKNFDINEFKLALCQCIKEQI